MRGLVHRGGLIAEILSDGELTVGRPDCSNIISFLALKWRGNHFRES
jgi:hypothetical protein